MIKFESALFILQPGKGVGAEEVGFCVVLADWAGQAAVWAGLVAACYSIAVARCDGTT